MILRPGRQPRMWQARSAQFRRLCSNGSKIVVFAIGLSAAALIGRSYWIVGVLLRPNEPMSVRIMYRYDDTDYLPLIYALARLQVHEFVTLGGRGVLPFPLLFEVPHSAMIALFG